MSRKEEKGWGTKEKILWQAEGIENFKGGKAKKLSNREGVSEKIFPGTFKLHLFWDDPLHMGTINTTIVSYCVL